MKLRLPTRIANQRAQVAPERRPKPARTTTIPQISVIQPHAAWIVDSRWAGTLMTCQTSPGPVRPLPQAGSGLRRPRQAANLGRPPLYLDRWGASSVHTAGPSRSAGEPSADASHGSHENSEIDRPDNVTIANLDSER